MLLVGFAIHFWVTPKEGISEVDMAAANDFGNAAITMVTDNTKFEVITDKLPYRKLYYMYKKKTGYNRKRWLIGFYAKMKFCKTAKFHYSKSG